MIRPELLTAADGRALWNHMTTSAQVSDLTVSVIISGGALVGKVAGLNRWGAVAVVVYDWTTPAAPLVQAAQGFTLGAALGAGVTFGGESFPADDAAGVAWVDWLRGRGFTVAGVL